MKYFPNSPTYIAHVGHRHPSASYKDTDTQKDFKDWPKCKQVLGYRVGAGSSHTQSPSFHSVAMCYVLRKICPGRKEGVIGKESPQNNSLDTKPFL